MVENPSALSEAPPTRKPSISGMAPRSATLSALAEPPYWMRAARHFSGHVVCKPATNVSVRVLSLLRRGRQARTDSPDRLVGDDEARPVARACRNGLELGHEDIHGCPSLTILLVLPAACHHSHANVLRVRDLGLQQVVRLAENVAALRMADERPVDPGVHQHLR